MLLLATLLKPYVMKENFSTQEDEAASLATNALAIILLVIILIISSYGAARLSYYYNMSTGNSGWAIFWSVLAFLFSDTYYPYYSFFLNPLSAKRGNNISIQ